jgi:predicted RNase H-like HicB family nuclease
VKNKEFYVVIEPDEDGIYVGEVPQLRACYSQGETIDELMQNIREVIELCLEEIEEELTTESIGKGLLLKILRDTELTKDELNSLLD